MKQNQSRDEHALPSLSLVFGYIAVKELRLLEDRVRVLARLGYGNAEIAAICGASQGVVRTLKSNAKKKPAKKSKGGK